MNLPPPLVELLKRFGYTQPEAEFLYIVATHSGYFTQRQFLDFVGDHSKWWRSSQFAQKVLNNGHAHTRNYMGYGQIYRLYSRALFGAIEKVDLCHQHMHAVEFIRTRLVLLDFVLAHRDTNYFETEQEKIRFFSETLGIPRDNLPTKIYKRAVRYFVDQFPMFLAAPFEGLPPLITLSYVDSGAGGIRPFVTHLTAYQPLLRQLASFRFLFISPKTSQLQPARERFHSMVKTSPEANAINELLRYFEVRRKWESHEYVVPVTKDLEFLRNAKRRFAGERFESLYSSWQSGRLSEEELRQEFCQTNPQRTIYFETCLVPQHRSNLDRSARHTASRVKETVYASTRVQPGSNGRAEENEPSFDEPDAEET